MTAIRDEWTSNDGQHRLILGDCLSVLPTFDAYLFDAIVTDPPAGIGFMGKEWDHDRGGRDAWIDWMTAVAFEMFAVLKPGANALVWALPRTSHWTATALDDAGFEVRDRISHLFGSGFPKSLDVSKAIDRAAGAEREVVGRDPYYSPGRKRTFGDGEKYGTANGGDEETTWTTAPATEAARQWNGWGTALKPACEDWWLVRKPLSEKTVAANVLRWGTGALNIDGCRIGTDSTVRNSNAGTNGEGWGMGKAEHINGSPSGRWPANVCLSHHPDCRLVGTKRVKTSDPRKANGLVCGGIGTGVIYSGGQDADMEKPRYCDDDGLETVEAWECHPDCPCAMFPEQVNGIGSSAGSAARFFYCAKASRADRGEDNKHPTVKNTALMRWLCRLITPPGGLILDCFMGSGSTAEAAWDENFRFVGIEQEEEYYRTAIGRMERELKRHPLLDPPQLRQRELI